MAENISLKLKRTDSEELTAAELLTRRQVPQIVNFLRECVPGYENSYLLQTANTVGVRETLHFKGLYTLTETDIINRTIFDDWIVPDVSAVFGNHNLGQTRVEPLMVFIG